jgi:exopolysaccharide biosynthesis polyprenyl glycosylphosphotransferase
MTVHINNQEVSAVVTNNEGNTFKIKSKPRGFHTPFFERRAVLMLGDALALALAAFGAFLLWQKTASAELDLAIWIRDRWYWFPILLSGWWPLAWLNDLYDVPSSFDKMMSATRVAVVGIISLAVYLPVYLLIPNQLPWAFALYLLAIAWPAVTLWRIVYATVLVPPNAQRRALIVGTGWTARTIAQAIKENDAGCEIIGYVAGDAPEHERDIKGVTVLGKGDNLTTFIRHHGVTDIVMAQPHDMHSDQLRAVLKSFEHGVRIVPMPKLFEEITGRIPVEHIDERWLFSLPIDWDSRRLYLIIKRASDIVIAGIGLLLLTPVFPFLVLAIKLDSSGPIFYRPLRLGRGGKPFRLWKFRTMVVNADRIGDPTFTARNDQRITRVGHILRTTHLDELPQFINVLVGEMSVVGPRPERHVPELEDSIPYYRTRYAVKPGATGWALVKQGYAEGLKDTLVKLQYDLYYIKHQSLSFDILILFKSIIHMLTMRGR